MAAIHGFFVTAPRGPQLSLNSFPKWRVIQATSLGDQLLLSHIYGVAFDVL